MNFPSVSRLRQLHPDFDGFLDDFDSPFHLTDLDIRIQDNGIRSQVYLNDRNIQMDYFQDLEGCLVSWYKNCIRTSKFLKEMDFLAVAFEDFEAVLRSSRKEVLEVLAMNMDFNIVENNRDNNLSELANKCHEHFSRLLKIQNCQVRSFEIAVTHRDQVLELLTNLDRSYLKKLKITGAKGIMKRGDIDELEMDGIIKMELWRNLEELEISNLWIQTSIQNLRHLKKTNIPIKKVTLDIVNELKEILLNSSHMESCKIYYEKCNLKDQLAKLYGDPFEEGNRYGVMSWKWFFRKSNTVSKVLLICFVRNTIVFEHIDLKNLPKNAMII